MLQRHGARYPASGDPPAEFATFLHGVANSTGFKASGPLEFLNTWTFELGAELLTTFGQQQLYVDSLKCDLRGAKSNTC